MVWLCVKVAGSSLASPFISFQLSMSAIGAKELRWHHVECLSLSFENLWVEFSEILCCICLLIFTTITGIKTTKKGSSWIPFSFSWATPCTINLVCYRCCTSFRSVHVCVDVFCISCAWKTLVMFWWSLLSKCKCCSCSLSCCIIQ